MAVRMSRGFVVSVVTLYALGAVLILAPAPAAPDVPAPVEQPRLVATTPPTPVAPVVDSAALERDAFARFHEAPLTRLLRRRARSADTASQIARALVREANRLRLAPSLLAAVLITENPRLEPASVSSQGATGLMQVMPFHAGEFDCASDDLLDVEANICHGARILGQYYRRTGDVHTALLRYNGCVASTNTPRCDRYPGKVLRLAGKMRREHIHYAAAHAGERVATHLADTAESPSETHGN
jgi:soluble lytic murein transglycosylase-like protein